MARNSSDKIYSATYSNVPVYEYNVVGNHVMRRRSDDWINATHILKVAGHDKPTRTRILEREVQKGTHEKVQGGYGKYQGTWISLSDGRDLAEKNGVLQQLLPIFNFVPGDHSPPPAPKHVTAASSKPRAPRAPVQPRRQPSYAQPQPKYDHMDMSMHDEGTPDNVTIISESAYGDYDHSQIASSRKRRRVEDQMSRADREHQLWADELLDYFMLQDNPFDALPSPPTPPANADLDRPIDEKGHTALHWAAAMGDIEVVKSLIKNGASIDRQSKYGETPLMRAVLFTNNFDRNSMEKLAGYLIRTVNMQEWESHSTVFHHIASATLRKSKYQCSRYYMDCLLNKMAELLPPDAMERVINAVDINGDTAVTIAARNGARKCVRSLIGRNAAVDVPNNMGETADQLIVQLNHRRQERASANRQLSSSPFQAESNINPSFGGPVQALNGGPIDPSLFTSSVPRAHNATTPEIYKSEAAMVLASQIIPSFFEKTKALAASLEAEIAEKDAEHQEAERLAAMRRAELDELRNKREELRLEESEQTAGGTQSDDKLLDELEDLERQCENLTTEEEDWNLRALITEEKKRLLLKQDSGSNNGTAAADIDMDIDKDASVDPDSALRNKLDLARQLATAVRARQELIRLIVVNASMANSGTGGGSEEGIFNSNGDQYRRLIAGALNVKEEDVTAMLPEILTELQEARDMETRGA